MSTENCNTHEILFDNKDLDRQPMFSLDGVKGSNLVFPTIDKSYDKSEGGKYLYLYRNNSPVVDPNLIVHLRNVTPFSVNEANQRPSIEAGGYVVQTWEREGSDIKHMHLDIKPRMNKAINEFLSDVYTISYENDGNKISPQTSFTLPHSILESDAGFKVGGQDLIFGIDTEGCFQMNSYWVKDGEINTNGEWVKNRYRSNLTQSPFYVEFKLRQDNVVVIGGEKPTKGVVETIYGVRFKENEMAYVIDELEAYAAKDELDEGKIREWIDPYIGINIEPKEGKFKV